MLSQKKVKSRKLIGRISVDTKGPPGIFMEATGLWDGRHLTS